METPSRRSASQSLECKRERLCITRPQIGCNLVSFGVLEPDYIEWSGIADALSTMQIAAIEAVKQMGQSRSVWTIFSGLKTQAERVL